jgi:NADH:ubiquinone oxidoreductase subunit C
VAFETISAGEWRTLAESLRGDGWRLLDLCGLDMASIGTDARFHVVVQLLNVESKERRSHHIAAEGEPPTVPSVVDLLPTANFFEREAFDMFGIHFEGHPNLKRILMPDDWEGHPLRKDYGVGKVPIDFVPQPFLQIEGPVQGPAGGSAGRRVDELGQTDVAKPDHATPGAKP